MSQTFNWSLDFVRVALLNASSAVSNVNQMVNREIKLHPKILIGNNVAN